MTALHRAAWMVVAFLCLLSLLLALPASSWAERPVSGSGDGLITSVEVVSSRQAGTNRIQERRLEGTLTGMLEGTFEEQVQGVVHQNGQVHFQGTGVFTGALAGCGVGTLNLRVQGRGQAGPSPVTVASIQVVDQASNTLPATGGGTVHQDGFDLTYDIEFVCRAG